MTRYTSRLYATKLVVLTVLFCASAVVLLLFMLRTEIGPFALLEAQPVSAFPDRVGYFEPERSRERPEWERRALRAAWNDLLPDALEKTAVTKLEELPKRTDALVVADASRLSPAEGEALLRWVEGGGSAILAGWIGSTEQPTELMHALLSVDRVDILGRDESYFVAAARRGTLNAGLAPGLRSGLPAADASPAIATQDAELVWSNWNLRPIRELSGASRRLERGSGRLAWIAVDARRAHQAEDREKLVRLFENALRWAHRDISGELHTWPGGAPFAGLIAMDTEDQFANAHAVAAAAASEPFPMTYLVVAGIAKQHPRVMAQLIRTGEIGSHADVHDGFKDEDLATQRQRLGRARDITQSLGASDVLGFRPPYESYDANTLRALATEGYGYQLGDLELDRAVPRMVSFDGSVAPLVQVPRPVEDDYDLFERRSIADPAALREAMLAEVDRSERMGGLHYFSLHTQYFDRPERIDALRALARELRTRGAWLSTGSELAAWWRGRDQVHLAVERAGPRRVRIRLTNRGASSLDGLAVRIYTNIPTQRIQVSGTQVFQELLARWQGRAPEVRLRAGAEHADLILPTIGAGESQNFDLDYEVQEGGT
jgi:peptidoglycan/xylan/chitin deacetylase (PgdA/CDA1 family)